MLSLQPINTFEGKKALILSSAFAHPYQGDLSRPIERIALGSRLGSSEGSVYTGVRDYGAGLPYGTSDDQSINLKQQIEMGSIYDPSQSLMFKPKQPTMIPAQLTTPKLEPLILPGLKGLSTLQPLSMSAPSTLNPILQLQPTTVSVTPQLTQPQLTRPPQLTPTIPLTPQLSQPQPLNRPLQLTPTIPLTPQLSPTLNTQPITKPLTSMTLNPPQTLRQPTLVSLGSPPKLNTGVLSGQITLPSTDILITPQTPPKPLVIQNPQLIRPTTVMK